MRTGNGEDPDPARDGPAPGYLKRGDVLTFFVPVAVCKKKNFNPTMLCFGTNVRGDLKAGIFPVQMKEIAHKIIVCNIPGF
jgi:hypothetical protein